MSDLSSDVCSSDLTPPPALGAPGRLRTKAVGGVAPTYDPAPASAARRGINRRLLLLRRILPRTLNRLRPVDRCLDRIAQLCIGLRFGRLVRGRRRWPVAQIGRAASRERGCQYVSIPVVAVS